MNKQEIINKTEQYLKEKFSGEGTGHDWWHIDRVRKNALVIGKKENVDLFVVELGALLHDIADFKFHDGDETIGPRVTREWLESLHVEPEIVNHVVDIVTHLSYKGAEVANKISTREGMVVQDADRLDAIGAIGIARCFAYNGSKGREIYNPTIPPEMHQTAEAYKTANGPALNHFYEKLLLLKDRMNTPTAKAMAEGRHKYLEGYISEFLVEWDSDK
jgi:uncharacterized protein